MYVSRVSRSNLKPGYEMCVGNGSGDESIHEAMRCFIANRKSL